MGMIYLTDSKTACFTLWTTLDAMKASQIGTDIIQKYILERQGAGAENGAINRELSHCKGCLP